MGIPTKPLLALLATEFAFASLAATGKIAVTQIHPLTVAAIRILVGGVLLTALALAIRRERVARADLWRLLGLAVLGVVLNQGLFLLGLEMTTATHASILIATIPVFTVVVALLLGRERLVRGRVLGILTAFVGVAVLLDVGRLDLAGRTTRGDLLILLNALSFAFFLVLSRPLLARYRSTTVVMWTFLLAGLILGPVGAAMAPTVAWDAVGWDAWAALAWVVLVGTVAAYALNTYALKRLEASTVASFILLQPLIGVSLAMLLLGEALTTRIVVGGLFVVAGLAVVTRTTTLPVVAPTDVGTPPARRNPP